MRCRRVFAVHRSDFDASESYEYSGGPGDMLTRHKSRSATSRHVTRSVIFVLMP
jgi:hypothetical protein